MISENSEERRIAIDVLKWIEWALEPELIEGTMGMMSSKSSAKDFETRLKVQFTK